MFLRQAEVALQKSPQDVLLKERLEFLLKRQADLESRTRFADDYPPEFALGATSWVKPRLESVRGTAWTSCWNLLADSPLLMRFLAAL